ncbi:MAG: AAA family ATPase [Paracoccaceae bacterium]
MMDTTTIAKASDRRDIFSGLIEQMRSMVIGQQRALDHLVVALLAEGHVLLEGAPGLAKTRLARLLSDAVEGSFKRIQFTPDLLPSDLIGSSLYSAAEGTFSFQPGPIFANFVLADEINRAPAKVQSALLEAMEERQVTSGDYTHRLDWPFFVVATQNPIEHDGTWDLPQAQLDRFLLQISLGYPAPSSERAILDLAILEAAADTKPGTVPEGVLITRADLKQAQSQVKTTYIAEPVRDYIVRLIAGTRSDPDKLPGVGEHLACPASPRGTIMLARAAQAAAWLDGRDHVLPTDVQDLAIPVLSHRIMLNYRADADGVRRDSVIAALIDQVDVL